MEKGDRAAKQPPKRGEKPRQEPAARAASVDERLQLAEKILGFATWDWDVVTGEVTWTPELEALYGLEPGAFGRTYADFACRVHPDDLDRVERCRDEAVAAGRGFDFDFRLVRPDGELRWVHCKGHAVRDASGRVRRVVGVNIDITAEKDLREALAVNEARLSTALKLSHLVIFHQDRQLRYTWIANPALVESAQDLLGRSDDEVLGKEEARPLVTISGA